MDIDDIIQSIDIADAIDHLPSSGIPPEMIERALALRPTKGQPDYQCVAIDAMGLELWVVGLTENNARYSKRSGPMLVDYTSGEDIRRATPAEFARSLEAAKHDGGSGVIEINDILCYVE